MIGVRASLPRFIQYGRAETVEVRPEEGGSTVPCTGGTYSLLDSLGRSVIDAQPVTVTAGVPSYAIPADYADDYPLPQPGPWRERWSLTGVSGAPSGELLVEQEVHVCRVAPLRLATVEDLYRLHNAWRRQLPQARPDVDEPIDVAWETLVRRLLSDGHIPSHILNWWRLSSIHTLLAAAVVCRDFATDAVGDSRMETLGTEYEARAWDDYNAYLGLQKDSNEDGIADKAGTLQRARPTYWLG